MSNIGRSRVLYTALTVGTLLLGLASRQFFGGLPFVRAYVGDALWAMMVFFGLAFVFPRWSGQRLAGVALVVAFGMEFSQLYHAPWIDLLRQTRLGGLVLGFGFVWPDLLCYSAGIAIGWLLITYHTRRSYKS